MDEGVDKDIPTPCNTRYIVTWGHKSVTRTLANMFILPHRQIYEFCRLVKYSRKRRYCGEIDVCGEWANILFV